MEENKLIKYDDGQLKKVENSLAITRKILLKLNSRLIPYRKIYKWGFCNSNKEIIINCIYDFVSFFENEFAKVKQGSKYGVVDIRGNEIIPCVYENLQFINENLIAIMLDNHWGFIDNKNQILIEVKYSSIRKFNNTHTFVELDNKWGIIDRFDNVFVDFKFDRVNYIGEDMCPVMINGKWGFLNTEGIEVIECKYNSVGTFSEGLCQVKMGEKWGFIDKADKLVIEYNYRWGPTKFKEGIAIVWRDTGNSGVRIIINRNEEEVLTYKKFKNDIDEFNEGLALVRVESNDTFSKGLEKLMGLQKKSGFINKEGEIIIPCIYEENNIGSFANGFALISHYYSHPNEWDTGNDYYYDLIGYISKSGVEYWEDGIDPQYYLDKYSNKESLYVNANYEMYLCSKAIKLNSSFSKAYFNRGRAIIKKCIGNDNITAFKTALIDFEKAIEIEPENSNYLYWLGIAKSGALDYLGAIDSFNILLEMDSENVDLLMNRAKAKRKILDYSGAIMDYTSVLDLSNNKDTQIIGAYIQRGIVKLLMNNFSGAIADYNSVLKIAPSYIHAYILRGDARQKSGDLLFNEDWQFADEICKKNGMSAMDKKWTIEYLISK